MTPRYSQGYEGPNDNHSGGKRLPHGKGAEDKGNLRIGFSKKFKDKAKQSIP
jgi:hypothetical protein